MVRCLTQLGLTPAARAKFKTREDADADDGELEV
jgi:hypothetical protein